jgi:hypothetical protein
LQNNIKKKDIVRRTIEYQETNRRLAEHPQNTTQNKPGEVWTEGNVCVLQHIGTA